MAKIKEHTQRKRINYAIKRLNSLRHDVIFSLEETADCVSIVCRSKDGSSRYGIYECTQFFEDFTNRDNTWYTVCLFIEGLFAATRLCDPMAYHNRRIA